MNKCTPRVESGLNGGGIVGGAVECDGKEKVKNFKHLAKSGGGHGQERRLDAGAQSRAD